MFKGYKSILVNSSVFIAAVLNLILAFDGYTGGFIGVSVTGSAIIAGLAGVNMILRFLSDTPIFSAESKEVTEIKTKLEESWKTGTDLYKTVHDIISK